MMSTVIGGVARGKSASSGGLVTGVEGGDTEGRAGGAFGGT
jgi:hypothetical protein